MKHRLTAQPAVNLVSLGCAKNLVDSERILALLVSSGFLIAEDPRDADICLVNTCGFIGDARAESEAVLRELSELKAQGKLRALAALGCLVQRAADAPEMDRFLACADARIGFEDYVRLPDICRGLLDGRAEPGPATPQSYNEFVAMPRLRIGAAHTAYLKISEGCSNPCRFCSIPRIRGRQVSRPVEAIVTEARELIASGARELNLIAQDTTSYGRDLYGELALSRLLRALREIEGEVWFRLMYAYPRHLTDEVLDTLASDPRFCPYIDLPLQHISDRTLTAMGRGVTRADTLELLERVRTRLPGVAVRSAFIVGHPGETEAEFHELVDFVRDARFTHAGVFAYSHEPMTAAWRLSDDVPEAEKERRRCELMNVQRGVSRRLMKERVGQEITVLVDGPLSPGEQAPPGTKAVARSQHEAPEVDGVVYLRGKAKPGRFIRARIVDSLDYDLVAERHTEDGKRKP